MASLPEPSAEYAVRCGVRGDLEAGFTEATVSRARELGVLGWVRETDGGGGLVHAEGSEEGVGALVAFLGEPQVEVVKPEGHEQFAVRGVSAGRFEVVEGEEEGSALTLGLELGGGLRRWILPKGPSMDPAVKRMAIEAPAPGPDEPETTPRAWDGGTYEQGGRVPWPEALDRGHAVFVLNGKRLRGGFALQRTRPGPRAQWLLIKRRDEHARRGSDVAAESADEG